MISSSCSLRRISRSLWRSFTIFEDAAFLVAAFLPAAFLAEVLFVALPTADFRATVLVADAFAATVFLAFDLVAGFPAADFFAAFLATRFESVACLPAAFRALIVRSFLLMLPLEGSRLDWYALDGSTRIRWAVRRISDGSLFRPEWPTSGRAARTTPGVPIRAEA